MIELITLELMENASLSEGLQVTMPGNILKKYIEDPKVKIFNSQGMQVTNPLKRDVEFRLDYLIIDLIYNGEDGFTYEDGSKVDMTPWIAIVGALDKETLAALDSYAEAVIGADFEEELSSIRALNHVEVLERSLKYRVQSQFENSVLLLESNLLTIESEVL